MSQLSRLGLSSDEGEFRGAMFLETQHIWEDGSNQAVLNIKSPRVMADSLTGWLYIWL